jgi:pimeloyl-ACP methyl ester carboxylesterase
VLDLGSADVSPLLRAGPAARGTGPTLILHGDDDQIVPIGASAMLSSKLVKNATLKVYKGAPHGMCTTRKDQVNEELLAFIKSSRRSRSRPLLRAGPGTASEDQRP